MGLVDGCGLVLSQVVVGENRRFVKVYGSSKEENEKDFVVSERYQNCIIGGNRENDEYTINHQIVLKIVTVKEGR